MDQNEESHNSPTPAPGADADEPPLNDREAADFLGISVRRLHGLRKRGELPAVRGGWRRWRFRSADLMAYAERVAGVPTSPDKAAEQSSASSPATAMEVASEMAAKMTASAPDDNPDRALAEEVPLVRMANAILSTALDNGASDIHVEPTRQSVVVRCRIDGVIQEMMALPKHIQIALANRYKVMADIDLFKRHLPQSGYIPIKCNGQDYNVRVSSLPTIWGESLVMRILDQRMPARIKTLGLTNEVEEELRALVDRPSGGLLLLAGPPGAGLTTTAASLLHESNSITRKIITIEEIREYDVPGVAHSYPLLRRGVTARTLQQTALRQQPDVLFLGDLRDAETAAVAVDAALSGVLTLATVAAVDAVDAVRRLSDLGITPAQIARALIGVLSQRLAQCVCKECGEEYQVPIVELKTLGLTTHVPGFAEEVTLWRAPGCESCGNRGYKGRLGVFELLRMTPELASLIERSASRDRLYEEARAVGMRSLSEDAYIKVVAGVFTPEEAVRVVGRATS
jgi:excisionase family DNA binding protein